MDSALTEWGSQFKVRVEFKEESVSRENEKRGAFAYVAFTGNVRHEQGVGRTKKDAKANAASIAFRAVNKLPPSRDKPKPQLPQYEPFTMTPAINKDFERQRQEFQDCVSDAASLVSQSTFNHDTLAQGKPTHGSYATGNSTSLFYLPIFQMD